MDFWNWDLTAYLSKFTCPGSPNPEEKKEESSELQVTIDSKGQGQVKYIFVRGVDKTIKFYNGEDYVQSFTSHEVILEWIQQFLELSPADLIIWNRQGEKGIYTPYSEERLVTLLKLLLSDQVV